MAQPAGSLRSTITDAYGRLRPGVREVIAFGIIGAFNMVLNVGLFTLLTTMTTLGPGWSSGISATITTVLSFVLNRKYAFRAAEHAGVRAFVLFVLVNLAGIGIETGLVAGAAGVFDIRTALPLDAVKVAAIGLGTVFRYVAYRYLVFPTSTPQHDAQTVSHGAEGLVRGVLPVRPDTD